MKSSNQVASVCIFLAMTVTVLFADKESELPPIPTHADAAIIFAKHSGLFDRYVSKDATLTECVAFLNKTGIYFGLMEVVNGKEFTSNDCARVMGQIELVFAGESAFVAGKLILPKNIDTWEEFCIMTNIDYRKGHQQIVQTLIFAQQLGR